MRRPSFYVWLAVVVPFVSLALAVGIRFLMYEVGMPSPWRVTLLGVWPVLLLLMTLAVARNANHAWRQSTGASGPGYVPS